MEGRKGDARIIIISGLIFLCIVSGGIFLCLFLFLPESDSRYCLFGMILISIPWVFWFLVCLYNCFKPSKPRLDGLSPSSHRATPATSGASTLQNVPVVESPVHDSPGGGQRRVHFGAVVVMGGGEGNCGQRGGGGEEAMVNNSHESHSKDTRSKSMRSRESEVPLRLSISS